MNANGSADATSEIEIETPTWRPSGVRRAVGNASELLYKLAAEGGAREPGGSIYEVLERTATIVATPIMLRATSLDARARWLIPFLDADASVEDAMRASGMAPVDALLGMCELVARGIVVLAPPRESSSCA